ncbi:MAG: CHAD domain-containing protein [Planctomycetota bacterium]
MIDHSANPASAKQASADQGIPGAKWFAAYDPGRGIDAARELLSNRSDRLLKAFDAARTDPAGKRIRKLRVATRRADVAARFALPIASVRDVKRCRRALRDIRRAGGAVRRCDLFIERLTTTAAAAAGQDVADAATAIIGRLSAERAAALAAFVDLIGREPAPLLFPDRVPLRDENDGPSATDLAMRALRDAAAAFAADAAVASLDTVALHDLRLRGKRLRYTAEAAVPVIGREAAADLIGAITPLQDDLGCVNDLAELAVELASFLGDVADLPGGERLRSGADRLFLTAAAERDRRAVDFAAHRKERISRVTKLIAGLAPKPQLRLAGPPETRQSAESDSDATRSASA